MLFHTPTFLVFFLVFCSFYFSVKNRPGRVFVLLIFSNIFYGWWDWRYLALLWATVLIDYFVARAMEFSVNKGRRKILITISLASNLTILGIFKYLNFFIESAEQFAAVNVSNIYLREVILPVGLSFYTFQSISYTVDVYRRKLEPVKSLLSYAAYVCYFPQLVAGPIERVGHLLPQILDPVKPTRERISAGIFLFCLGFFKKGTADTFALLVNPVFKNLNSAAPAEVVFALFGFGLQIYLDFSGYTDMARGISKVMGIDLMMNFKTPYFSLSPREFWRRWHISLSQWLRDYLYISLGGNRVGIPRHFRNLMITMILGGLWHGAGFNFMIWGALHGAYLCLNTLLEKKIPMRFLPDSGSKFVSGLATFILINYAWLYFRCPTVADAMIANKRIIQWLIDPKLPVIFPGVVILVLLVIFIDVVTRICERDGYQKPYRENHLTVTGEAVVAGLCFVIGMIFLLGLPTQQFIYFQF
jgi:D-alanyl-lipoteichoic acid acyltransferase DltB (MBOAT superfamily)